MSRFQYVNVLYKRLTLAIHRHTYSFSAFIWLSVLGFTITLELTGERDFRNREKFLV